MVESRWLLRGPLWIPFANGVKLAWLCIQPGYNLQKGIFEKRDKYLYLTLILRKKGWTIANFF